MFASIVKRRSFCYICLFSTHQHTVWWHFLIHIYFLGQESQTIPTQWKPTVTCELAPCVGPREILQFKHFLNSDISTLLACSLTMFFGKTGLLNLLHILNCVCKDQECCCGVEYVTGAFANYWLCRLLTLTNAKFTITFYIKKL